MVALRPDIAKLRRNTKDENQLQVKRQLYLLNFKIDLQLQKLILHMLQYAFQADYNFFLTIWHFRLWSVTDYIFAFFSDCFQCNCLCLRRLRAPCHCLVLGLNDQQAWGGCWLVSQVLHVPCVLNHESHNQCTMELSICISPKVDACFLSLSQKEREDDVWRLLLSAQTSGIVDPVFSQWADDTFLTGSWIMRNRLPIIGLKKEDHNQNKRKLARKIFLEQPRQYYSQFLCYV